jgi:hypothetical protein
MPIREAENCMKDLAIRVRWVLNQAPESTFRLPKTAGKQARSNNGSWLPVGVWINCNHPQPRLGRNTALLVDAFGMPRAPVCCGLQTRISAPNTPVSCPPNPRAPPATAPGDAGVQVTPRPKRRISAPAAGRMPGDSLAGGGPTNRAGCGKIFRVTGA